MLVLKILSSSVSNKAEIGQMRSLGSFESTAFLLWTMSLYITSCPEKSFLPQQTYSVQENPAPAQQPGTSSTDDTGDPGMGAWERECHWPPAQILWPLPTVWNTTDTLPILPPQTHPRMSSESASMCQQPNPQVSFCVFLFTGSWGN